MWVSVEDEMADQRGEVSAPTTKEAPLGHEEEVEGNVVLGRGMRTKVPSTKLLDFVTHNVVKKKSLFACPSASSLSPCTPYPIHILL